MEGFNGAPITRRGNTIFIPLPRAAWRPCPGGTCTCPHCKATGATEAFWDTLAIAEDPKAVKGHFNDYAWSVHYPELHPGAAFLREGPRGPTAPEGHGAECASCA